MIFSRLRADIWRRVYNAWFNIEKTGKIQYNKIGHDLSKKASVLYERGMIMEALTISPDFTIEDIHKLREYNYYLTKDMSPQERRDYYNKRGMEVHRQIQERKLQNA